MPTLKINSQGDEVFRFYDYFSRWAKDYSFLLGKRDGYYGSDEARFVDELQRRLGLPRTGIFSDVEASRTGYRWTGTSAPPVVKRRKIWIFTAPGSGARWDFGPSFDLGNRCQDVLKINHQPVSFQMGGYLGFMGGDPKYSYNDVTYDQYKSLEWLMDNNPDAQEALRQAASGVRPENIEFEMHASGYSQSADGFEDALEVLFGDGGFIHPGDKTRTPSPPGKYKPIRDSLKLVVQFGNPSTKDTGIARKKRPEWLNRRIRNINKPNDFYAVATDTIRPAFYAIIVQAEMELPFFIHVMKIAMKVMEPMLPIFGGLLGPLGPLAVAGLAGINQLTPMLGGLMGQAGGADEQVDRDIVEMLTLTGMIKNVGGIIGLVGALPGLQAHGMYGPVDVDAAYNHIAGFKR